MNGKVSFPSFHDDFSFEVRRQSFWVRLEVSFVDWLRVVGFVPVLLEFLSLFHSFGQGSESVCLGTSPLLFSMPSYAVAGSLLYGRVVESVVLRLVETVSFACTNRSWLLPALLQFLDRLEQRDNLSSDVSSFVFIVGVERFDLPSLGLDLVGELIYLEVYECIVHEGVPCPLEHWLFACAA